MPKSSVLPRQRVVISYDKMRRARREKRITQGELADAVGVHKMTILRIEKGRHKPTLDIAVGIARALGKTVAELIELTEI